MTFWINGARTIVIGRTCRCMICMCLYSLGDYNVRLIESQSLTMTCGVPESRLGISEGLPLLPYGDKFNLHRKLLQQPFSKRGCDKFLDLQAKQRSICLQSLLRSPHEFEQHTKRFVFYFRFSALLDLADPAWFTPQCPTFLRYWCDDQVHCSRYHWGDVWA